MRERRKSKYKLNIIISSIGMVLCIAGIILELLVLHESVIFWTVLLLCNAFVFVGSLINYKRY